MFGKALLGQEAWIKSRSADGERMTIYQLRLMTLDARAYKRGLHQFAGSNERIGLATMAIIKFDGLSIPACPSRPHANG